MISRNIKRNGEITSFVLQEAVCQIDIRSYNSEEQLRSLAKARMDLYFPRKTNGFL